MDCDRVSAGCCGVVMEGETHSATQMFALIVLVKESCASCIHLLISSPSFLFFIHLLKKEKVLYVVIFVFTE